ncbi:MAG: translation elongation factor EF-1 subunit alpha [Zestosphaera sp.]
MSRPKKEHMNLVVIGHVDHGKSTLVGHTLLKLGALDPKMVKEVEEAAKKAGKESEKYAWFLDKLKEERDRGLTIALSFMKFETPKYYWTIIDAPGHRDFVKNMITGASQADVALLVVSAKTGEFEAGMSREGQTMEHIVLARTMGIDQVVVAITKMDITEPPFSKDRYLKVVDTLKKFMRGLGYKVETIPFIPVSGWLGENLTERSPNMTWYNGPTLVEALDSMQPPPKPVDKPLRIPVQEVYSITGVGTVPVGRVETGRLRKGDVVVFMPAGVSGEVRSIEMHHEQMDEALPGDNIGFNVKGISKTDIKRGDVAGHPQNPPTVAKEFTARVYVVQHPTAIHVGYTPVIHAHTASVASKITEIIGKLDPKTGQIAEKNPQFIKAGESAVMKFQPIKPMVVEKYSDIPQLGRFALRDMGKTVGIGVIMDVVPAEVKK